MAISNCRPPTLKFLFKFNIKRIGPAIHSTVSSFHPYRYREESTEVVITT